jgi:hypothetical protein
MKPFRVDTWNHILIEGYCTINHEYDRKHGKYVYVWDTSDPDFLENHEKHKQPNPDYDPTVIPNEKPEYCKGHIGIECLMDGNKCPHFGFCLPQKKIRKKFKKLEQKEFG